MEAVDQVKAASAGGLTVKETESLLGRKLSDEETVEFTRTKALVKLKNRKDKAKTPKKSEDITVNSQSDCLKPPVYKRYTKEQISDIVERTHGLTSSICAALDCSYQQWHSYLERRPEMRELQEKCRQSMVDMAEKKLMECLNSDDDGVAQRAAEFILRRMGAKRGWGDSPVVKQCITTDETDGKTKIMQIFGMSE